MFFKGMRQKIKFNKMFIVIAMAIISTGLIYACDSGSDEQFSGNTLQISLSCPDLDSAARQAREAGIDRTFNDIVTLLLTVEGGNPPLSQISEEFDPEEAQILIDVPAGTDRLFTIIGLDINENIICRGETETDININIVDIDIPCEFVIEECDDGIDNDFDDLIDCEDPDCEEVCMQPDEPVDPIPPGDNDDDDVPSREDDFAGECSDEIDNDLDGFTDCDDNDCIRSIDCRPEPPQQPGVCTLINGDNPDCNNPACCSEEFCICQGACFNPQQCCDGEECFYESLQLPAFCSDPEQN